MRDRVHRSTRCAKTREDMTRRGERESDLYLCNMYIGAKTDSVKLAQAAYDEWISLIFRGLIHSCIRLK